MKHLLMLLFVVSSLFAMDEMQIRQFITGSICNENATYLGFSPEENLNEICFGEELAIGDIVNDSLENYPNTGFAEKLEQKYVPVILGNSIRCFVIIDREGYAVSLGYRTLAVELTKIAQHFNTPLESVELYRSSQVNSYLFSIPTKTRGESPNLTLLNSVWNGSRSALTSEETTIQMLQNMVEGGQQ